MEYVKDFGVALATVLLALFGGACVNRGSEEAQSNVPWRSEHGTALRSGGFALVVLALVVALARLWAR